MIGFRNCLDLERGIVGWDGWMGWFGWMDEMVWMDGLDGWIYGMGQMDHHTHINVTTTKAFAVQWNAMKEGSTGT